MNKDLDDLLCQRYPYMFKERNLPMHETCMCWGFSHGDGWFNIINQLCNSIEHHVKWARSERAKAIVFNRRLRNALKENDINIMLRKWVKEGQEAPAWAVKEASEAMALGAFRHVPDPIRRVVVKQVKEKFGTLRFDYEGGDAVVDGMVRMAEAMSAVTCETCGKPANTSQHGYWVGTLCADCADEHAKRQAMEQ